MLLQLRYPYAAVILNSLSTVDVDSDQELSPDDPGPRTAVQPISTRLEPEGA